MNTSEIFLAMANDPDLSAAAQAVGTAIHACIEVMGKSPSVARLAQLCKLSERQAYRAVSELVSCGWIAKEAVAGMKSNYALPDERIEAIEDYIRQLRTPASQSGVKRRTPDRVAGVNGRTPDMGVRGSEGTPDCGSPLTSPPVYNNNYYPPDVVIKGEGTPARAEVVAGQKPLPSGTASDAPPPVVPRPVSRGGEFARKLGLHQAVPAEDHAPAEIEYRIKDETEQRKRGATRALAYDPASGKLEFVNGVGAELKASFELEFPGVRWARVLNNAAKYITPRTPVDEYVGNVRQWAQRDADDRRKEKAAAPRTKRITG